MQHLILTKVYYLTKLQEREEALQVLDKGNHNRTKKTKCIVLQRNYFRKNEKNTKKH